MATDSATAEVQTREQLDAKLDTLWVKHAEAAKARNLRASADAVKEIRKVEGLINGLATAAEADARKGAIATMNTYLGAIKLRDLLRGVGFEVTARRDEDGLFSNISYNFRFKDETIVPGIIAEAVQPMADLKSVKGVTFTIGADGSIASDYTGGKSGGGGGGGGGNSGKGWIPSGGGEVVKLGEAFDTVATDEEKAEVEGAETGSKQWQVKTKVVKASGYTINE